MAAAAADTVASVVPSADASRCIDLADGQHRLAHTARALLSSRPGRHRSKRSRGLPSGAKAICLVIDSGATWHIHQHASDLINLRPCKDEMTGLDRIKKESFFLILMPTSLAGAVRSVGRFPTLVTVTRPHHLLSPDSRTPLRPDEPEFVVRLARMNQT